MSQRLPTSVWSLALALGIGMSGATIAVRVAAVFGEELSGRQSLATLPTAMQFFGVMLGGMIFSNAMARYGRKRVLMVGLLFGVLAGLIGVATALAKTYWSLFPAHFLLGLFLANIALLRFTAADQVDGPLSARALSLTLFGGVIAAFVGPGLVFFSDQVSSTHLYMLSYGCIALVSALVWLLIAVTRIREKPLVVGGPKVAASAYFSYPYFTAVFTGAAGYGIMSMLMTAAALHMKALNGNEGTYAGHFGENVLTFAIMWHVVAMFGPMVIMAQIAARLGLKRLMVLGAGLLMVSALIGALYESPPAMFIALILLGFGWAGTYGASGIMIKQVVPDEARFSAQGTNEMTVSFLSGIGAVSAGPLLESIGWQAMNMIGLVIALWLLPLILLNRSKEASYA